VRRLAALSLFLGILAVPAFAFAQAGDVPVVDVVEVVGVVDRPIERYLIERIDEAERDGVALLVLQVDSLGGLKVSDDEPLPPVVRRVRDARVPVAVHVGPRAAHAGGVVAYLAAAAHVVGVGPSATIGPADPVDFARPEGGPSPGAFEALAAARGRAVEPGAPAQVLGANASVDAGLADVVAPSVAELLRSADGRTVATTAGTVTLDLPEDGVDVRVLQPGPIRRLLHTFANPTLVYLLLLGGAMLVVFELFQPGFGVAGWTAAVVLGAAAYGLTVLPARALGIGLLAGGLVLLGIDVALDGIRLPTFAGTAGVVLGSLWLYPNTAEPVRLSPWLAGAGTAAIVIMFVPVMTVVRRARRPVSREVRDQLVGERGRVRSMLNPEGFVEVDGEIWRARSKDGSRRRVGEDVVVDQLDGGVLIVIPGPAS